MYLIRELAGIFGLSRSTLLYYDQVGLLSPSARSEKGYRLYSDSDRDRLSAICSFREAGLSLEDIRKIISSRKGDTTEILLRRLSALSGEIQEFQTKRRMLAGMLKVRAPEDIPSSVDKNLFVGMLKAAGMMMRRCSGFTGPSKNASRRRIMPFFFLLTFRKKRCSESADGPQACPWKSGWVSSVLLLPSLSGKHDQGIRARFQRFP